MSHHLKLADIPTCVLVRHAHAGDPDTWDGPDDFRPLSPVGWSQADDIIDALRPLALRWLLSSPSLRCRQTLVPLARAVNLDIQPHVDLSVHGSAEHVLRLMSSPDEDGMVLCSHGEVIDEVLDHFPGARENGRRPLTSKGGVWVVRGRGTAARLRYFPPRHSEAAEAVAVLAAGGAG